MEWKKYSVNDSNNGDGDDIQTLGLGKTSQSTEIGVVVSRMTDQVLSGPCVPNRAK